MPRSLGATEFSILRSHANAGDRIAYYTQLDEWGYRYGGLALGVVNNDTVTGATANIFFLQEALELGIGDTIDYNDLAQVSLQLMRLDLQARETFSGSAFGLELPVDAIQAYHAQAFTLVGMPVSSWTPNFVLETFATAAQRDAYWDNLLGSGAIGAWAETRLALLGNLSLEALDYKFDIQAAGVLALTARETDYGPFLTSLGNADGGLLIGGNYLNDSLGGSNAADVIMGFDGDDRINGFGGNDRIYGGDGDDEIEGGGGADFIDGGDDSLFFGDDVYIDSFDFGAVDTLVNIEEIRSASGDGSYDVASLFDSVFGIFAAAPLAQARSLSVTSDAADEVSSAPRGPASLSAAVGANQAEMTVDENGDLAITKTADGASILKIGDFNWGDGSIFLDTGRESRAVLGSDENDRLFGTRDADLIVGAGGDDVIRGYRGNDEVSGEAGDDRLFGHGGDDSLYGDRGADKLYGGWGNDRLWGGADNDHLDGGAGGDALSGGVGDDKLYGRLGDDILNGGLGADRLDGGWGRDTADYSGSEEGVTISLTGGGWFGGGRGTGSGGDAEGDRLSSIENVVGSDFNDAIAGNRSHNQIEGGRGDDELTGGHGNDSFIFRTGDGADTITDFEDAIDRSFLFFEYTKKRDQIVLEIDGVTSFDDLSISDGGGGALIDFGNGDSISLTGIAATDLSSSDFQFV